LNIQFARPYDHAAEQKFNSVDLFAGAGGFSLAALNAGFNVRLAVEHNVHACETYRFNFCTENVKGPLLKEGDITEFSPDALMEAVFKRGEDCDLLLGGPPCQGFSSHRLRDAGVDDPRNKLVEVYFNFVKAFRPKVFLMENVPGMLWPRHRTYVDELYRSARQHGYHVMAPTVMDARDYGVWQRRSRVFILGVRKDLDFAKIQWPPAPTHGSQPAVQLNPQLTPWLACGPVFAKTPPNDENNVHMNHSAEITEVFRATPHNGGSRKDSGRVLPCHESHDGHKDVYGRINPTEPAPTMTTACINPSKGRFVHPTLDHGITVRQAARIQTFPDSFVFKGGLMAAGQQIGNAVPILLAERIILHIKNNILQLTRTAATTGAVR
jgi:DNA (cytosine-5)-methyltransferase 1